MVIVVLTGGIGSGKSAAAEYFRGRGAVVVDLDDVATRLMAPGSPLLAAVASEFGAKIVCSDGSLDRAVLARSCFADRETAHRLDEIVHPVVADEAALILRGFSELYEPPVGVILEVPLLVEAPGFAALGDVVLAIAAPEAIRVERTVARGMDRSDVLRRVSVQASDSERAAIANVVIENDGTLADYVRILEGFWDVHVGAGGSM